MTIKSDSYFADDAKLSQKCDRKERKGYTAPWSREVDGMNVCGYNSILTSISPVYNRQLRMLRHPLFVANLGKMRYNVFRTREGYLCSKSYMQKARFGLR